MELRYTVIDPTKNITLLVTTPVPRDVQPRVAAELLRREKDAEQVGFAEGLAAGDPRLQKMGGEFCGNATMSMFWMSQTMVNIQRFLSMSRTRTNSFFFLITTLIEISESYWDCFLRCRITRSMAMPDWVT